jgi:hypothetical protein
MFLGIYTDGCKDEEDRHAARLEECHVLVSCGESGRGNWRSDFVEGAWDTRGRLARQSNLNKQSRSENSSL